MHLLRFCLFPLFLSLVLSSVSAQDFSNKGKEFWIPYSYHVGAGGASLVMTLYITSDVNTSYQVAIHGGVTLQSGNLTAGQVVTCIVPNTYFVPDEGLYSGKAIVVTSDKGGCGLLLYHSERCQWCHRLFADQRVRQGILFCQFYAGF